MVNNVLYNLFITELMTPIDLAVYLIFWYFIVFLIRHAKENSN